MAEKPGFNMGTEFAELDFNSKRLERRFIKSMETLSRQPEASIWVCSENRAEAKAIYRMLGNENFDREEILQTHRKQTVRRMVQAKETILLVQDTTSLNYNTHLKTKGIGYISDTTLGVNIHTCLAVTASGLVLGILGQMSYNRERAKDTERTHDSKKVRLLEEKESYRWVKTMAASTAGIPEDVKTVSVCDREGDMYELFNAAERSGQVFLIRIAQNRMTMDNKRILNEIRQKPCAGKVRVTIPRDSRRNVQEREAVLYVRYGQFEIRRPAILNKVKTLNGSVRVSVIYAEEETVDGEGEAIRWFLMTNESVERFEAAYEKVRWYTQRWKIERFHYVLKSGCAVEKLQERTMEKTTVLVLMYSVIAAAIMNLTYIARLQPELPCTVCFEEGEWQLLYRAANKTKKSPAQPYTIREAVGYLGCLGGPKRAPSDGPPGVKAVWTGLSILNSLLTYREWLA